MGKILLSTLESCHDPQHGKKVNHEWRPRRMKIFPLGTTLDNEETSMKKIFQMLGDRVGRKKYYTGRLQRDSDAF